MILPSLPQSISFSFSCMKRWLFFLLSGLLLQSLPILQAAPQPQHNLQKVLLSLGTNTLAAEVAADDASRELGLMARKGLDPDEGMVFVFPQPRSVNFWMKDTPIPLSIAYISASGRILETHELKPLDETPVPSTSSAVVYALEVPQGWFASHGVLAGDQIGGLPLPAIAK
jgi:uncharacterized membrane protein (UPF0127 family)